MVEIVNISTCSCRVELRPKQTRVSAKLNKSKRGRLKKYNKNRTTIGVFLPGGIHLESVLLLIRPC